MGVMFSDQRSAPLCSVCDGRLAQEPIILCSDCVHPDRVRTFCSHCELRLDLSLDEAIQLFAKSGLSLSQAGVCLLFTDGCPDCTQTTECSPPVIFTMEGESGSPPVI